MKELGKQTGRLITILLSAAMVLTSIPTEVFAFSTDVDEVIMEEVIAEDIVSSYDTVSEEDMDIVENGDEDAAEEDIVSMDTANDRVTYDPAPIKFVEKVYLLNALNADGTIDYTKDTDEPGIYEMNVMSGIEIIPDVPDSQTTFGEGEPVSFRFSDGYRMQNSKLDESYFKAAQYDFDVMYFIGTTQPEMSGGAWERASVNNNLYTIPTEAVSQAEKEGKNLYIGIAAYEKKTQIYFKEGTSRNFDVKYLRNVNEPAQAEIVNTDGMFCLRYNIEDQGIIVTPKDSENISVTGIKISDNGGRSWTTISKVPGKDYFAFTKAQTQKNFLIDFVTQNSAITFETDSSGLSSTIVKPDKNVTAGSDGKWTVAEGTGEFTYTIESRNGFVPIVTLKKGTEEENVRLSYPILNSKKDGFVYTVKAVSAEYSGKKLIINERHPDWIVSATKGWLSTSVRQAGSNETIEPDPSASTDEYNVYRINPFKAVTINAAAENSYKIGGVTVDGVNRSMSGSVLTFNVDALGAVQKDIMGQSGAFNTKVDFIPGGELTVYRYASEDDPSGEIQTGTTFSLNPYDALTLGFVTQGVAVAPLSITTNAAAQGSTSDWYKIDPDTKKITIYASGFNTNSLDGAVVTVKLPGNVTKKYTLKVKQVIGSVKVNNKAGGVFTQAYGSDASYKLTLNNGADFGELTVKAFIGNSTTADSHNLASISDGRLTVRTYYENGTYSHYGDRTFPNYYLIKDPITLRFYRPGQTPDSEEEISGCTCTINPASPSLPKPTKITASNITDVSMDIRVAIVKNLPYKNMMVCIDREPVGAVPENMDSGKITFFAVYDDFKSSGSIYTGTWSVVGAKNAEGKWKPEFPPTPGTGSTQKFIYTATMVQYSDLSDIKDENILAKSQTLTATASTKALQYENALSLTAKTGAFTAGGPNVTLAEVKYSKATYSGYKKLDPEKTYLVDAEGNKIYLSTTSQPTVLDLSENNNNLIILTNTAYIAPGTATLYVEPLLPSNTLNTAKTLKFTVKKPISNITILPCNTQLRKALNKDISLKFTAKCTYTDGSPSASSNVKWAVGTGSGDSFAEFASSDRHYDKVTINAKTGQLKVAKDYIPTADDKFCLRVTANDYVGNTVFAERELAIVTDEITVTDVSVPGVDTDHAKPIAYSDTDTSSQENYLVGRSFVIKGRRGSGEEKIIPNSEFTFKSSSSGLTVDDTGRITKATRAGIYTVSIIPNQGGTKLDKKITVEDVKPSYVFTVLTDDPTDRSSNIMPRHSFSEDAFESGIPVINVDNLNVCYVMASLMRGSERSTLTYSPKWSCKGASTVKTMYRPWDGVELYGVFKLKPGENTLTFSGGYKGYSDKTIKIINNVEGTDKLKRVDSTKIVENSGVTAETGYRTDSYDSRKYSLEFEVSGNVRLDTDCGIYLGFEIGEKTMNDNARKNHYAQMARYLRDSRDDAGNVINTTYPANNRIRFTHDFDGLPKGDYQFYATLYDRDGEPLTKPVEVMIKVRALYAAKSAIKSSVNMTKAADGYRYGELSMKSSSNIIDYKVVAILNNNKGGEVNKFTKFFRLDNSGTTPRLVSDDITGVSADDMTGWVRYKTLGEDGHTEVERTEKITVVLR